jgi:hypothetical protein
MAFDVEDVMAPGKRVMQASSTVASKKLVVSCLANLSASNRRFPSCDSQPADEDSPKNTSAPVSRTQGEQWLVAWISYRSKKVFIRYVLSHPDYDKKKWKDDCDCD